MNEFLIMFFIGAISICIGTILVAYVSVKFGLLQGVEWYWPWESGRSSLYKATVVEPNINLEISTYLKIYNDRVFVTYADHVNIFPNAGLYSNRLWIQYSLESDSYPSLKPQLSLPTPEANVETSNTIHSYPRGLAA